MEDRTTKPGRARSDGATAHHRSIVPVTVGDAAHIPLVEAEHVDLGRVALDTGGRDDLGRTTGARRTTSSTSIRSSVGVTASIASRSSSWSGGATHNAPLGWSSRGVSNRDGASS